MIYSYNRVWNKRMFYLNGMKKAPGGEFTKVTILLFLWYFCKPHVSLLMLHSSKMNEMKFSPNVIYSPVTRVYPLRWKKKKKTLCKFSGELRDGAWGARGVPADGIRFKVLIKRFTRHGSKARTGNDNEIKLHVGHKGMQLQNEAPPRCRDARQKTHEHRENKIHTAVRRQTRKYPRNIFVTSEALTLILHRVVRFSRGTLAAFAINRVRRNIYKLPLNESNQISRPLT